MLFPISTDAPIYHRPFGTVLLIAANCATFFVTEGGEAPEGWLLRYGEGLHPDEWLASAFLHFGFVHLLGNMVFLWAFGLVVEGKLGTVRFLAVYLGMCCVQGALVQTLMLLYDGPISGAGGASGAIFGLMAIALVWAPENCLEYVWFFSYGIGFGAGRGGTFESRILTCAIVYIGLDLLSATMEGFSMTTSLLHLLGAAVGAPVGLALLKKDLVDCEGWDLISLWKRGHYQWGTPEKVRDAERLRALRPPQVEKISADHLESTAGANERLREAIDGRKYLAAWALHRAHSSRGGFEPLDRLRLQTLIDGLVALREWAPAAKLLSELIARFPENSAAARVALAGIYARDLHRPRAALQTLDGVDWVSLDPSLQKVIGRIRKLAESRIREGTLELQSETGGVIGA